MHVALVLLVPRKTEEVSFQGLFVTRAICIILRYSDLIVPDVAVSTILILMTGFCVRVLQNVTNSWAFYSRQR